MLKYGGMALCVLAFIFLCLFIEINCSILSTEARIAHRNMEIRLNSFQNELSKATLEIEDIRVNRGSCTCPTPNVTATAVNLGQPGQTKEAIEGQSLRTYNAIEKKAFSDEKRARKRFEHNLKKYVQDHIKSQDDSWSAWGAWGSCSATCNGGMRERHRSCEHPDPSQLGKFCIGNSFESKNCNNNNCPNKLVYFTVTTPDRTLVTNRRPLFTKVVANEGDAYDMETAIFTCPVAGLYMFSFTFVQTSTSYAECTLYHNSEQVARVNTYTNDHWASASGSVFVRLNKRDTFDARDCNGWSHVDRDKTAIFTGALVKPS